MTPRVSSVMLLAGLALLTISAGGCCWFGEKCPGELVTWDQLVDEHNANAEKVPALWAIADVELNIRGWKFRLPDGTVRLAKNADAPYGPQDFILRAKEVTEELFRLGVDAVNAEWYVWAKPPNRESFARWGRLADLHRPGWESPPVDPSQLLSVLGVLPWRFDAEGTHQAVAYTASTKPCVYKLLFVAPRKPAGAGMYVQREVWLDRHEGAHRPEKVLLFDPAGQIVMEADLGDYQKIEAAGDEADWPVMPTDIRIAWPQAPSDSIRSIRLRLHGQTTENPTRDAAYRRQVAIPRDIDNARPVGPAPEPARPAEDKNTP